MRPKAPSSRARFITDADGRFFFRTILPCSYPIPTDGPVGEMILQTRRHPMRPAHVHFLVNAKGYQPLITHVFMDGDKYLDSDVVFGVKDELIAKVETRSDKVMPDGKPASGPWHLMTLRVSYEAGRGRSTEAARHQGHGGSLRSRPAGAPAPFWFWLNHAWTKNPARWTGALLKSKHSFVEVSTARSSFLERSNMARYFFFAITLMGIGWFLNSPAAALIDAPRCENNADQLRRPMCQPRCRDESEQMHLVLPTDR